MATTLDILVINTYNAETLGIADNSVYDITITAPTINITVPGEPVIALPFAPNEFNVFNSTSLGLTTVGQPITPLPDGVYLLRYTITPSTTYFTDKSIMRTALIQEKFDNAFMRLDMMECDSAIRMQSKVTLNSIYYMIQGSIAAANNAAVDTANKLYAQADRMLDNFIRTNCGCSGNNYVNNFY
jgi:hypothetical protein